MTSYFTLFTSFGLKMENVFRQADFDTNGMLDEREMGFAMRMMGIRTPLPQLKARFEAMDQNKDGQVTALEFLHYYANLTVRFA